ncbi:MAG: DUF1800 domain-containing protein, partial [Angustibacter sp.]
DGFPLGPEHWGATSSTLERWNVTYGLVDGTWPAALQPAAPLLDRLLAGDPRPSSYAGIVDSISRRLFALELTEDHRLALLNFVGVAASAEPHATAPWAELPQLIAALLGSPYHLYR